MNIILEFVKNDMFLIYLTCFCILIFLLYIINCIKLNKIRKEYKEFMQKLGEGSNIEEMLNKHIEKINRTITKNEELEKFCTNLDSDIKHCIQKMRNI